MASDDALVEAGYVFVIIVAFVLVLLFLMRFAPVEPYHSKPMSIYSGMQMS